MFHTLVFSGGASHVCTFFGCIRYLEHVVFVKGIRKVVGSSAGAFVALLVALGLTSSDMESLSIKVIGDFKMNKISLSSILDIGDTYGVDDGSSLIAALRYVLGKYMNNSSATFKDLAQQKGIDLTVCVLNVTKSLYEYISVDNYPDMQVATAVLMSMSVPLIYAPVSFNGCLFVDPVIGRNFPHDYTSSDEDGVLGFSLKNKQTFVGEIQGIASYMMALSTIMIRASNDFVPKKHMVLVEIKNASCPFTIDSLEFKWTSGMMEAMIDHGYKSTQDVLSKLDIIYDASRSMQTYSDADQLLHHKNEDDS
jgi:predicted acylesterase/phospholipase RssA